MTTNHATTPTQQAIENWRLMTAIERAGILKPIFEKLSACSDEQEKCDRAIIHILEQASHLDEFLMLDGATGESNKLYHQARGFTLVLGTENAKKLPILIQLLAALLVGNPVSLSVLHDTEFSDIIGQVFNESKMAKAVFTIDSADGKTALAQMMNDTPMLAQVAIVGEFEEVQALSAQLSKTKGMLTQVIAITDQNGLKEIFNPDYLSRFCTERVCTINTTAIGGNASLIEMGIESIESISAD